MPGKLGDMLKKAVSKMTGEEPDTAQLEAVSGIGKGTAEVLWEAGIRTPEQLTKTDVSDLTTIQGIGKASANKMRKAAEAHLKQKAPSKKKTKKAAKKTKKATTKQSKKKKSSKKTTKAKKKTAAKKTKKKKPTKKAASKKSSKKGATKKSSKKKATSKKTKKKPAKKAKKRTRRTQSKKKESPTLTYKPKKTLESVKIRDPGKQPWVASRSKIKAAIDKGLPESYLRVQRLLYLGAAHGYTISHIHDKPIELYAVEKSREMMQHFLPIAQNLPSVFPIFADATAPDSFAHLIPAKVDVVFQDIAQRNQAGIFLSNCERFLAPHGVGILALKARNVNSTAEPAAVFAETRQRLEQGGATIVQEISLEPKQEGHRIFVIHMSPLMDW